MLLYTGEDGSIDWDTLGKIVTGHMLAEVSVCSLKAITAPPLESTLLGRSGVCYIPQSVILAI